MKNVNLNLLLENIYGVSVNPSKAILSKDKIWYYNGKDTLMSYVYVCDFSNKCKLWAITKGYSISSYPTSSDKWSSLISLGTDIGIVASFHSDTEEGVVLQSTSWVLNNLR